MIVWVNSIIMMFGQMAPFYLLWNGAFCTCKMQVQAKLQQFWGVLRKSPTPRTVRELLVNEMNCNARFEGK